MSSSGQGTFRPVQVGDLELSEPLKALAPSGAGPTHDVTLLLRLHTVPIGEVRLTVGPGGLPAGELAEAVWAAAGPQIRRHLDADGLPVPPAPTADGLPAEGAACRRRRDRVLTTAVPITVVICTRDRPASLLRCLRTIAGIEYPDVEVVVVDSAPSTDETARVVEAWDGRAGSATLRYVREARPGLSIARNRGLACATGSWVAMTDDDVSVDRNWLAGIAESADQGASCVTGLVLPAEITTTAQDWFEQYGGFKRGFTLRQYDLDANRPSDPLFPFTTGRLGAGANMAFEADALRSIGGFDNALGAGTPARGGEDLLAFLRMLLAGHTLVYQPDALVRHWHRRDAHDLRRQVYGYGVGLGAYLTSAVLRDPRLLPRMLRQAQPAVGHLLHRVSAKNQHKSADFPRDVELAELLGLAQGPFAYARGRWRTRAVPT